jgi:hypothetical protein
MSINHKELITNCKHFTWSEALYLPRYKIHHIPTSIEIANIQELAEKLDKVRELLNKPIIVSCWIRPISVSCDDVKFKGKNYNAEIGGAKSSSHIVGLAIDFQVKGMTVDEAMKIITPKLLEFELCAENNGSKQKRNWIHLQSRQVRGKWGVVFNP